MAPSTNVPPSDNGLPALQKDDLTPNCLTYLLPRDHRLADRQALKTLVLRKASQRPLLCEDLAALTYYKCGYFRDAPPLLNIRAGRNPKRPDSIQDLESRSIGFCFKAVISLDPGFRPGGAEPHWPCYVVSSVQHVEQPSEHIILPQPRSLYSLVCDAPRIAMPIASGAPSLGTTLGTKKTAVNGTASKATSRAAAAAPEPTAGPPPGVALGTTVDTTEGAAPGAAPTLKTQHTSTARPSPGGQHPTTAAVPDRKRLRAVANGAPDGSADELWRELSSMRQQMQQVRFSMEQRAAADKLIIAQLRDEVSTLKQQLTAQNKAELDVDRLERGYERLLRATYAEFREQLDSLKQAAAATVRDHGQDISSIKARLARLERKL